MSKHILRQRIILIILIAIFFSTYPFHYFVYADNECQQGSVCDGTDGGSSDPSSPPAPRPTPPPDCKPEPNHGHPIYLNSGEFRETIEDLSIPNNRGLSIEITANVM